MVRVTSPLEKAYVGADPLVSDSDLPDDLARDSEVADAVSNHADNHSAHHPPETAATIKTKYESNADTNAFTDDEKRKLGGITAGAGTAETGQEIAAKLYALPDYNQFTDALLARLRALTAAGIKTQYESNANTNAFTDSDKAAIAALPQAVDITTTAPTTDGLVVTDGHVEYIGYRKTSLEVTWTAAANAGDIGVALPQGSLTDEFGAVTDAHEAPWFYQLYQDTSATDLILRINSLTDPGATIATTTDGGVGNYTFAKTGAATAWSRNRTGNYQYQLNSASSPFVAGTEYTTTFTPASPISFWVKRSLIGDGEVIGIRYNQTTRTITLIRSVGDNLELQLPLVTTALAGLMSAADKATLDAAPTGEDYTAAEKSRLAALTDAFIGGLAAAVVQSYTGQAANTDDFDSAKIPLADDSNPGGISAADFTKLRDIEAEATGDLTPAEIKTEYESNANTNAFTDSDRQAGTALTATAWVDVATGIKEGPWVSNLPRAVLLSTAAHNFANSVSVTQATAHANAPLLRGYRYPANLAGRVDLRVTGLTTTGDITFADNGAPVSGWQYGVMAVTGSISQSNAVTLQLYGMVQLTGNADLAQWGPLLTPHLALATGSSQGVVGATEWERIHNAVLQNDLHSTPEKAAADIVLADAVLIDDSEVTSGSELKEVSFRELDSRWRLPIMAAAPTDFAEWAVGSGYIVAGNPAKAYEVVDTGGATNVITGTATPVLDDDIYTWSVTNNGITLEFNHSRNTSGASIDVTGTNADFGRSSSIHLTIGSTLYQSGSQDEFVPDPDDTTQSAAEYYLVGLPSAPWTTSQITYRIEVINGGTPFVGTSKHGRIVNLVAAAPADNGFTINWAKR